MSNTNFVVFRLDIVSRKTFPKKELFRLVKDEEGKLQLDKDSSLIGRGLYLHKDEETLKAARKKGVLKRYSKNTDFDALFKEMEDDLRREEKA